MAYRFIRRPDRTIDPTVVQDLDDGSSVPVTEPSVQAAIAAGQVQSAPAATPIFDAGGVIPPRRLRTTNATPAELFRHTVPVATEYSAVLTVRAIDDNITQIRDITIRVKVARGASNGAAFVPTRVGAQNTEIVSDCAIGVTAAALALPSFSIERAAGSPVGSPTNDLVIRVTGVAGAVNWLLTGTFETFAPLGA